MKGVPGQLHKAQQAILVEEQVVFDEEKDDANYRERNGNGDGGDHEVAGLKDFDVDGEEDG